MNGFRRFEQQGIRVQVAQTARVDVTMQVGSTAESVTVTADAPLLRTENAAQATTVGREQLNALPLNFAIGAGAVRNPLSFVQLSPGASISGWNTIRVNGAPSGTFKIVFEGQDSTSGLDARVSDESQPSVEAWKSSRCRHRTTRPSSARQAAVSSTSRRAPGTNEYHGTLYDYFAHEKLYAARPFTATARAAIRVRSFAATIWARTSADRSFCRSCTTATIRRSSSSITRCSVTSRPTSSASARFPRKPTGTVISRPH